jgi:hypothetical protein
MQSCSRLLQGANGLRWVRGVIAGNGVVPRVSVAPQERRLIAGICLVVKCHFLTHAVQEKNPHAARQSNKERWSACPNGRNDAF